MGNSRKLKKLERTMNKSRSYNEWREAAIEHDEVSGKRRWREIDQTTQYDYAQIRLRQGRAAEALQLAEELWSKETASAVAREDDG